MKEIENPEILSKEDVRQAKLVQAMCLHEGYPVLVEFWNAQREAVIAMGKNAAKTKDSVTAAGYWMMLDGFDKAATIVEKIAARADEEAEAKKLEKEGSHYAEQ